MFKKISILPFLLLGIYILENTLKCVLYWYYGTALGNILKMIVSNALLMTMNNVIIVMTYTIDEEDDLLMARKVH